MIKMSIGGFILAPIVDTMHLKDWWHPHFIFNSIIKIEDLLFGFTVAGIISAIYSIISSKNNINNRKSRQISIYAKTFVIISTFLILISSFYLLHFHSFWVSVITMIYVILLYICFSEKQTILSTFFTMLITGILMVIIALPGYQLGIYMNPEWINQEYYLKNLSHIFILSVPIEELIWFFLAGVSLSAFQELFYNNTRK